MAVKLPLALLTAYGLAATAERPATSRGFAGRAQMLELWSRMDADQQDQLLLAAEAILVGQRRVTVSAGRPVSHDLADVERAAADPAPRVGSK